jgi:hypothetical protein
MATPEKTIHYKTSIKRSMVESMREVFAGHPDKLLAKTKVSIEYPQDKNLYPSVIVRFFESQIKNMGVGHFEVVPVEVAGGGIQNKKFKHYLYTGQIEFAIYALSSIDRDLIADTIVQTLSMGDLQEYTNKFFMRVYESVLPESQTNFININTDIIQGLGEAETPAPWEPDTQMVYQTSYRCDVGGEFYSLEETDKTFGILEKVNQKPYVKDIEEPPAWTS